MDEDTAPETRVHACPCGSDTFRVKWDFDGDIWGVCSACGRPTALVGSGLKRLDEWEARGGHQE